MLDTLQKMSGIRHVVMKDTKTVTKDLEKLVMATEGKVSYQFNAKEVPVISYNDMAFLTMRNAIVFRAGDPPIWNRNETILLMSWRLFQNTIIQPGKDYSLQTIPTLSTALEFDVRKNQPDFIKMWEKRRDQALASDDAQKLYQEAYDYSDNDIMQLDPDVWAEEVMSIINSSIRQDEPEDVFDDEFDDPDMQELFSELAEDDFGYNDYEDNVEQTRAIEEAGQKTAAWEEPVYAGRKLSRANFMSRAGMCNHGLDSIILEAFRECKAAMYEDNLYFRKNGVGISSSEGVPYIVATDESQTLKEMDEASQDEETRTFAEPGAIQQQPSTSLRVTDAFLKFLVSQEHWTDFAGGKFEEAMEEAFRRSLLTDIDEYEK